ncbi:DUF7344 domain-containing protein [Natrinema halophilum]|uniref:DUF7344 domain-containing protein n=1 Tax=Natrinema halophilum TaxID=1699371 RepID=A0A7D5L395_9EURY|nr:hypothetical protein [Natrinema halophilum]QLG48345.1 hypothetical protein HYG82_05515 [Natrinema halophilum]
MVTLGTIFDLLQDERRRYALYYLYEQDGPVAVTELVKTVDDWETDQTRNDQHERFDKIAVDLRHTHLPKSAEVEFLQYDQNQGIVQVSGTPTEFDAIITIARLIEQPEK